MIMSSSRKNLCNGRRVLRRDGRARRDSHHFSAFREQERSGALQSCSHLAQFSTSRSKSNADAGGDEPVLS